MTVTQFLISFSIIMMMLSLVSERASNFIKLYYQSKEISIPFLYKEGGKWKYALTVRLEILAYKQPTAMAEKEREYRVMIINVLVGILIATLANANFFEIVTQISSQNNGNTQEIAIKGILANDLNSTIIAGAIYMFFFLWSISLILFSRLYEYKTTKIGFDLSDSRKRIYIYPFLIWLLITVIIIVTHTILKEFKIEKVFILSDIFENINFIAIIRHIFGFTITGFFLSLGSKFWHDLLDVLFKLKNTQQILSENKTYTDYGSADSLIAYAETSQYDIVEGLYKAYMTEIAAIDGVLSHGLYTILDEKTKLYKKIIEIEFTGSETQGKLDKLKYSGSIQLTFNNFYLKDYLFYRYTSKLVAISDIVDKNPVCYAFNANSSKNTPARGSFSVYKENDKYYAKSNLHVFADVDEFKEFETDESYDLIHRTVHFVVGKDRTQTGQIIDYKFGNIKGYGIDFCTCEVDEKLYNLFLKEIDHKSLTDIDQSSMRMFGSYTKYVNFHPYRNPTICQVEYAGFKKKKELLLMKIGTSSSGIKNIEHGDSGSLVYYKTRTTANIEILCTGILVAKSDDYAYMFLEENIN